MKNILIIIALLAAFTTANAETNTTATTTEKATKETKATVKETPTTKDATAAYSDDSSKFVGTNDFYLLLVREGIRKG